MRATKLLLASMGVVSIFSAAQAAQMEQWGRIKCLRECTNTSCADSVTMEKCEQNCSGENLEACRTAKVQPSSPRASSPVRPRANGRSGPPAVPPRAAPLTSAEQSQLARPVLPPPPAAGTEQAQPEQSSVRPALRKERPQRFALQPGQKPAIASTGESLEPSGLRQSGENLPPPLKKQPSEHNVTGAGKAGVTAAQIIALNEGKGVKVKHMKEKLEGLEHLVKALQDRINLLEPLEESLLGVQESLKKLEENTGFDNPEIRNDPEHDIQYKPEQFSVTSSASSTLDGISCEAAIERVKEKTSKATDPSKAKELEVFSATLTEMCKMTKDLSRTPAKKVHDAEAFNRIYAEAKKLF